MSRIPPPLLAAARARPDHLAIVTRDRALTWRELADEASRLAGHLVHAGVRPGDVVTLGATADLDFVVRLHAIGLAGAIAAPREQWCFGEGSAPFVERDWPLGEPRLSLLTSGTTGQPREIVLTTEQLVFSAMGSAARLGHHLDDRWLACLPLNHVGGLSILFRTAWLATTCVLEPRFDAERVAELLDRDITMVSLVPTMLARILDVRETFSPRLRVILLGGDAAPPALLQRARGAPIVLTWGMTETASQIATGDRLVPLPFARVTSVDGALVAHGPIAPGGRHVTSDRGEILADGSITIHGRTDLVFISGGENVDPVRIERALLAHPAVEDALVVGLPDPVLGARAGMVLVPRATERPPLSMLRAFLAEQRLAPAERPSRLVWADEIPRGPAGKPSRERARALLEEQDI